MFKLKHRLSSFLHAHVQLCEMGQWRAAALKEQHADMDFGPAGVHGTTMVTPHEVRSLPDELGIPSLSVCVANTNCFVNRFKVKCCAL